jgi:hypothetical protein
MSTAFTSGKMKFEFNLGTAAKSIPRDPDAPLHILVMGHFGGSQPAWKAVAVDCDNFDQVMPGLKAVWRGSISGRAVELSFSSVEDFHPDRILPRIEGFIADDAAIASTAAPRAGGESHTDLIGRLMGGAPPPTPPQPASGKVDITTLLKAAVGGSSTPSATASEQAARSASDLARAAASISSCGTSVAKRTSV